MLKNEILKRMRTDSEHSIRTIAYKTEISVGHVSNIESGKQVPGLEVLGKLLGSLP